MNEKKICIIICTNNELALEECFHYLNHLEVPEGYEIELLTIKGAECITKGYNEGMKSSDAKYKIYMHQDVYVLNRFLLYDLLDIFNSDSEIGMIGMVGYEQISPTGIMWHEERFGRVYGEIYSEEESYPELSQYRYSLENDGVSRVAIIDGLMMITSQDIEWNTEDLDAWDFYDAYQSMNYLEHGLKIVVPKQRHPWVMHDDGHILNMRRYDKYRQRFLTKYENYLGKRYDEITGVR